MSLVLYSVEGDRKAIPFGLGALNVITGQSKTGKSMLVRLIDYCLGRATVPTSAGRVEEALSWVGAVWQFEDQTRVFVGRPIPAGYRAENTEVMLSVGDDTLVPPDFANLQANTNTRQMRYELGARIGISENRLEAPVGSARTPLRTHLGHAALLCLQNQDEISSATRIFHRSGERGIDDALRDTIPYFLGAVPADQALLKAMLRQEQRRLRRAEQNLREAQDGSRNINEDLLLLLGEAVEAGLAVRPENARELDRQQLVNLLHSASRQNPPSEPPADATVRQDARRAELAELAIADDELDQLIAQRSLLLDESEGGGAYEDALEVQFGRLASLGLIRSLSEGVESTDDSADGTSDKVVDNGHEECPVCGQHSGDEDATSAQLRIALEQVSARLSNFRSTSPARSEALDALNLQITEAQARVRRARAAIDATLGADATVGRDAVRRRDFTRGRIDAILSRAPEAEDSHIAELQERVSLAEQSVSDLQARLSDDAERERLNSRLIGVGRDLTNYAQTLELEHSGRDVRIDLSRLTVIADVNDSPVPLHRIGSAENWIGYHIAAHLALHQTFIRHGRPVPRILVIDQPSQGHYPSEVAKRTGVAGNDADEIAVRRLYDLMNKFVDANDGKFQVIAVDHADIDLDWFQQAVVAKWRGKGNALVPEEWLPEELVVPNDEPDDEVDEEGWEVSAPTAEELVGQLMTDLLSELVNEPLHAYGISLPVGAPPLQDARISELTVQENSLLIDLVDEHDGDTLANATMVAVVVLTGELTQSEATAADELGEILRESGVESDTDVTVTLVGTHNLEIEAGVLFNEATQLCQLQQVTYRRWSS